MISNIDKEHRKSSSELKLGANLLPDGSATFMVWAPKPERVDLKLVSPGGLTVPMERDEGGYWVARVKGIQPGTRYFYRLNGESDRPDPASKFQPDGVHGPSAVVSSSHDWTAPEWHGLPLCDLIIYELHVGTYTEEGTFDAILPHIPKLKQLGITAVEIMPVAQFPGSRNWGYDGVGLFAVQNSYGGPEGIRRFVDRCHQEGLAVILDVVYNHLGPEGNYLGQFGHYFTDGYRTPWGSAMNFDGPYSGDVRRFFIENAHYWQHEMRIDGLRLDAIHAIRDFSATPFLQRLAEHCSREEKRLNRQFWLIAENDLNNPRFVLPPNLGGCGLDAQWSDDFHHCLHVLLTGERRGYYEDFDGTAQFAKVFREGYAYTGEYSKHRKAEHGALPTLTSLRQFVVCSQNHDQIGNRAAGDRLTASLDLESLKLAAAAVILSPFVPLLFMGEEHAERAPFQYFTSHSDPQLVEAVRKGRREEFSSFEWVGEVPDPQDETTFRRSRIEHGLCTQGHHKVVFEYYRELIRIRREFRAFTGIERGQLDVSAQENAKAVVAHYRPRGGRELLLVLCFEESGGPIEIRPDGKQYQRVIDSTEERWGGPGSNMPELIHGEIAVRLKVSGRAAALYEQL